MRSVSHGVVLAAAVLVAIPLSGGAQSWRTVTMSRQVSGEDDLKVNVRYGAGRFQLRPGAEGVLYRMELRYDEETFEPVAEFRGNRLDLGVESIRKSIRVGKSRNSGNLELTLARDVAMDLELEFGAVRADLDLGGLYLTGLDVRTGASESTVDVSEPNRGEMRSASFEVGAADFTARHLGNLNARRIDVDAGVGEVTLWFNGAWQQDARVSVNMGLGALELRFPEGLGVRLKKDSFLTSFDSEGMMKRGDAYYSPDWETADRKVTLDLDAAFGSVKVVWVR